MAAINEGEVPQELQEPLMARANELVNAVNCPPPAEDEADEDEDEEPGKGKGRGKKKGHDADEPVETVVTVVPPDELLP